MFLQSRTRNTAAQGRGSGNECFVIRKTGGGLTSRPNTSSSYCSLQARRLFPPILSLLTSGRPAHKPLLKPREVSRLSFRAMRTPMDCPRAFNSIMKTTPEVTPTAAGCCAFFLPRRAEEVIIARYIVEASCQGVSAGKVQMPQSQRPHCTLFYPLLSSWPTARIPPWVGSWTAVLPPSTICRTPQEEDAKLPVGAGLR